MSFSSCLYTLIISPLELLFENIFMIANRIIGNEGLSIIFLSLAVNFLVLPLYKRADELQTEEREIQAKMAPWIKHIKRVFSGDERFFMLQEYYRINHYKPIYALKSSFSILLQIPFFIAAYNLLSGMQSIKGMQFGIIADLGKEDAMFSIGNFPVNVLPILMTLINIVSGIIYTKGHPLKEKIQVYGLAAIFLVLLYHSPAGLVFYWLLNNMFSLVKNIFYKLKNPKKVFYTVLAAAGAVCLVLSILNAGLDTRQKVLLATGCVLLTVPFISGFVKFKFEPVFKKGDTAVFFAGVILMALITGLVIPSAVISDSVLEFVDITHPYHPLLYVVYSLLISFGSWVLWGGIFYFFMSEKIRSVFSKAIWVICGISIADYMLFGKDLGIISSTLQYEKTPSFSMKDLILNTLVFAAVLVVFCIIIKFSNKIPKLLIGVGIMVFACIGILNSAVITGIYRNYMNLSNNTAEEPSIPLSKNGKNVVVLMLDRAMGTQVPYIFNEKPELKEKFDGFTYYPNTASYGLCTLVGAPSLFGGYEYTPENINARSSELMAYKHDEALKVMPVIFGSNNYSVTICDPAYAGYSLNPDLSIYKDYPSFRTFNTDGRFNLFDDNSSENTSEIISKRAKEIRNHNFYMFALMKVSPLLIQETLYNSGSYNDSGSEGQNGINLPTVYQKLESLTFATGYDKEFIESYSVLNQLPKITAVSDSSENTFLMMTNDTTHSPCILQEPDYTPAIKVDNTAFNSDIVKRYTLNGIFMNMTDSKKISHYHVNMAAYLKLAEWFDYLRANGVYDNTRIILVADHGRDLGQFDITCNGKDMESFMPLLMVKDFNAKGFNTSEEFMTNADTPTIAMSGLIDSPVNPFTGKPINSLEKNKPIRILHTGILSPEDLTGTTFPSTSWYEVKGNIYNPGNWKYLGDK